MARYKENEVNVREDGAILVKLTQGKVAIVDPEDWERIKKYTWCAAHVGHGGGFIAVSSTLGRQVYMHRVIMGATYGDGQIVDHINHNRLDNRRSNLRFCTQHQSSYNKRKYKRKNGTTSTYKGVSLNKKSGKWIASCSWKGKRHILGHFDNEAEAAQAYNDAAEKHHGEFAHLNTIED